MLQASARMGQSSTAVRPRHFPNGRRPCTGGTCVNIGATSEVAMSQHVAPSRLSLLPAYSTCVDSRGGIESPAGYTGERICGCEDFQIRMEPGGSLGASKRPTLGLT